MNAISVWCILGDFLSDKWRACPTTRFAYLYEWLRTSGLPRDKPIKELFQEWSKRLGYTPIDSGLKRNAEATERFILRLEKSRDEFPDLIISTVLKAATALAENNKYLSSLFINDPESYVSPYLYNENRNKWPAAPIMITFNPGGLLLNSAEVNKNGFRIIRAQRSIDNSEQYCVYNMIWKGKSDGVDMIDTAVAENLFEDLTLIDFYYSEFRRNDRDFDWVRQNLQNKNDFEPFGEILS